MQMAAFDGIHKSSENAMCNRTNTHLLRIYNKCVTFKSGEGCKETVNCKIAGVSPMDDKAISYQ